MGIQFNLESYVKKTLTELDEISKWKEQAIISENYERIPALEYSWVKTSKTLVEKYNTFAPNNYLINVYRNILKYEGAIVRK